MSTIHQFRQHVHPAWTKLRTCLALLSSGPSPEIRRSPQNGPGSRGFSRRNILTVHNPFNKVMQPHRLHKVAVNHESTKLKVERHRNAEYVCTCIIVLDYTYTDNNQMRHQRAIEPNSHRRLTVLRSLLLIMPPFKTKLKMLEQHRGREGREREGERERGSLTRMPRCPSGST